MKITIQVTTGRFDWKASAFVGGVIIRGVKALENAKPGDTIEVELKI